jgi:hypothetical protein
MEWKREMENNKIFMQAKKAKRNEERKELVKSMGNQESRYRIRINPPKKNEGNK